MQLFQLLTLIVKYNLPFTNKSACINEIKEHFVSGGGVWQKFAQMLSGQGEIIGHELAQELQSMYFDCPAHDDKYSARIIKDAFGDTYDTKRMKMIGSGTISQVYKIHMKDTDEVVAFKVMHPNIKNEIKAACELYDSIKDSYMFPSQLKKITQMFFLGLKDQLDMNREFKNGKTAYDMFKGGDYVITPKMIACSKKCLAMSYEESMLMCNIKPTEANKHELMKACNGVSIAYLKMLHNGIIHMDLHPGNYGINKDNKLVIYDFGQCVKVTQHIDKWIKCFVTKDYKLFLSLVSTDRREQLNDLYYKQKDTFERNVERTTSAILTNDYQLSDEALNHCIGSIKLYPNHNIVTKLLTFDNMDKYTNYNLYKNGYGRYITKYFPYPEFEDMKRLYATFDE
jgi:predicted unusual protein kinase regulating ubiquinone biosynthesis (AarF/ABC1/UbiB family)